VATLERELVTAWGPREAPGSERVPVAWLGAFASAWLRTHPDDAAAQTRARGWIRAVLRAAPAPGHVPGMLRVSAGDAGTRRAELVGEPASIPAAAELLRVWIEELERAGEPAPTTGTA
jgi:hypothetical protein